MNKYNHIYYGSLYDICPHCGCSDINTEMYYGKYGHYVRLKCITCWYKWRRSIDNILPSKSYIIKYSGLNTYKSGHTGIYINGIVANSEKDAIDTLKELFNHIDNIVIIKIIKVPNVINKKEKRRMLNDKFK